MPYATVHPHVFWQRSIVPDRDEQLFETDMTLRRFSVIPLAVTAWAVLAPPTYAAPVLLHSAATPRPVVAVADDASGFIEDLGRRAIDVLTRPQITKGATAAKFQQMLSEGFDVPLIGRFVLGQYWRQATPQQQQEYIDLFTKLIAGVYADRFSTYAGKDLSVEKNFKILGSHPEGNADQIVTSNLIRPDGPALKVDWRVRNESGQFKIIDVAVEGVSMSVTQRSEFSSVIQRGGGNIESLLQALRQRVAGT
ncbi:MAG: ABC transporter substrate-binding protein [Azospirillaceae bacterium]|nr:ABC transporter substrate-binding protein [Azospirillaceae bacterium]